MSDNNFSKIRDDFSKETIKFSNEEYPPSKSIEKIMSLTLLSTLDPDPVEDDFDKNKSLTIKPFCLAVSCRK